MDCVAQMERCDRFCKEFAGIAREKLTIKSPSITRGELGFDEDRVAVLFFMTVKDREGKKYLVTTPYVIYDPEKDPEAEMELVACRLGLLMIEVRQRFKSADLL